MSGPANGCTIKGAAIKCNQNPQSARRDVRSGSDVSKLIAQANTAIPNNSAAHLMIGPAACGLIAKFVVATAFTNAKTSPTPVNASTNSENGSLNR